MNEENKNEQVSKALTLLQTAVNLLKTLGVLPPDPIEVPNIEETAPVPAMTLEPAAPAPLKAAPPTQMQLPMEVPVTAAAKKPAPQRGAGGRFLPPSGIATPPAPKPAPTPKPPKPLPPPKPVHKYPAPDTVDAFITWFFQTPEADLYACKCGQYSVVLGDVATKTAHTLIFTTARKTWVKLPNGAHVRDVEAPENANNVIGIRPIGTRVGIFNGSRILYGRSSSDQLRPQASAEAAGAAPVPFENVVAKDRGAGLDLSKLEIVDWKGAEQLIIPPVRLPRWQVAFSVAQRHFAGALVLRVEDKYFLFDCDREEVEYCGFNPFFTQLPLPAKTVEEAYTVLMPDEAKTALARKLPVKRQGEFFFIPCDDTEMHKVAGVNALGQRELRRITEDLVDCGTSMFMWLQGHTIQVIQTFQDRCRKYCQGMLPSTKRSNGTMATTGDRDVQYNAEDGAMISEDFMTKMLPSAVEASVLDQVIDRIKQDINQGSPLVLDERDGANEYERWSKNKSLKDCGKIAMDIGSGNMYTNAAMHPVYSDLRTKCAFSGNDDIKPVGEYSRRYGIYLNLNIGRDGGRGQNAHVATGTLYKKNGDVYAIGMVRHTGREHKPLLLTQWHKVVSNTATANWSVSGDVD